MSMLVHILLYSYFLSLGHLPMWACVLERSLCGHFSPQAACMHAYVLGTCPYASGSSTLFTPSCAGLAGWVWMVSPCEDAKGMQMWGWQRRPHRKPVQGAQTTPQSEGSCRGLEPQGTEGQEGPGLLSSTSLGVCLWETSRDWCLSALNLGKGLPSLAPYLHPMSRPQLPFPS